MRVPNENRIFILKNSIQPFFMRSYPLVKFIKLTTFTFSDSQSQHLRGAIQKTKIVVAETKKLLLEEKYIVFIMTQFIQMIKKSPKIVHLLRHPNLARGRGGPRGSDIVRTFLFCDGSTKGFGTFEKDKNLISVVCSKQISNLGMKN